MSIANLHMMLEGGTNGNPVHPTPRPEFTPHANQKPVFVKLIFSLKPIAGVNYDISGSL